MVGRGKMELVALSEEKLEPAQLALHVSSTMLACNKKTLIAAGFMTLAIQIETAAHWKRSGCSLERPRA